MRHVYMRGILTLIWLAAAIVSGFVPYALMGAAFSYSAWAAWKKEKNGKKEG